MAAEGGFGGTDSQRDAVTEIERLARRVRDAAGGGPLDSEVLRRTLFRDLGFVRVVEGLTARHMLLPPVLQDRRGSCVGLGCLFLALADRVGVDRLGRPGARGTSSSRCETGAACATWRLLRAGEAMPESWYRSKYAVPRPACAAYLRPLTPGEVLAVVRFNLGNHHREARRP